MQLEGSSALCVGGAGGFGAATVRRLVQNGAKVVIADLAADQGRALADELGDSAVFVETNVLDDDSVAAAVAAAVDLGPLRLSVDTHGGPGAGKTIDRDNNPASIDAFRRVIDVFLNGSFNVLRQAAAAMAASEPQDTGERGLIVNTASIAGFEGTVGQAAYGAAKAGIIGMTLPTARDLAPVGVRVLTIAPGVFATPAYGEHLDQVREAWDPVVPFPKRMGEPDEYARLVIAMAENPYLNGETIRLDGALRFMLKGNRP